MNVYETVISRRSIRRFKDTPVPRELLERCVNAARLAPSAGNLQPLEYIIIDDEKLLPGVFSTIKWAAYIKPRGEPPPVQRPAAYITVLRKKDIGIPDTVHYGIGMAAQNIMIVALAESVGSCAFGGVNQVKLRPILNVPADYEIPLVLALGYPDEAPIEEPFDGSVKYWRDENDVHHVPKKRLEAVRHWNMFQAVYHPAS